MTLSIPLSKQTYKKYWNTGYGQQGVIHGKFEKVDYMLISKTVQNNSTLAYIETAYEDLHTSLPKMRVLFVFVFFNLVSVLDIGAYGPS